MEKSDENFAESCNRFMEMVPNDEDFGIILDHDAMFTTTTWMKQIQEAVSRYPQANAFCAITNRIYSKFLWANAEIDKNSNDIAYHRSRGKEIAMAHGSDCALAPQVSKENRGWGGYFMMLRKRTWREIGGFRIDKAGGTDWNSHADLQKIGEDVYVLQGVYLYHWYTNFNPEGYSTGKRRYGNHIKSLTG